MAKWTVEGMDKKRGKLVPISDTVQGAESSSDALQRAFKKYPRARELSVKRKVTKK